MNALLTKANRIIRKERPLDMPSMIITIFRRNNFLQLTFQTSGCRYSSAGTCTMCNYGKGVIADSQIILDELDRVCHSKDFLECDMILLGASGSFLDESEIPEELQYTIMKRIAQTHMKEVYIETHYKSITISKLKNIHTIFPHKCVCIEMGLETTTIEFQDNILNKNISLHELKLVMNQIHTYDMRVSLNVLLGLPFLTKDEQLADTLKSIDWALENGADDVVVFPVNIHPYTVFEWWHKNGYIELPSLWLLFELLLNLPDKYLPYICISWYGNRNIYYSSEKMTCTPYACANCQPKLLSFFEDFASNFSLEFRKEKLHELVQMQFLCDCRQKVTESTAEVSKNTRWNEAHKALERWINKRAIN